jgi:ribosomal protein S20
MRARLFMGGFLAISFAWMTSTNPINADDKGNLRASVQKIADALAKDDAAGATRLAADVAKSIELEEAMNLMKRHDTAKDKSKVFGMGEPAGSIKPDGIEAKILGLGKINKSQFEKESSALATMADRVAAIALIAKAKAPEKDEGAKKKKDWLEWVGAMESSALELASAARAKNLADLKKASTKLNSACANCHGVFRD